MGTSICPNELIFYAQIEDKKFKNLCFIRKKIHLIKFNGKKLSFKIFAPTMSSILRPRIILDFLKFYLIKLIYFIKLNVLVLFSAICA